MTDVKEAYLKTSSKREAPARAAHRGHVCMSCGGEVAEDGNAVSLAEGGEVEETPEKPKLSDEEKKALFERALKEKRT